MRKLILVALLAASTGLAAAPDASAVSTLYWDTNGSTSGLGGTGTWDTSTTNWSTSSSGNIATQAWTPNDCTSIAVFAGTVGVATLADSVNVGAGAIIFQVSGDCIASGSSSALWLGNAAQVVVKSTGNTAWIKQAIYGTSGLNFVDCTTVWSVDANNGNLVLTAANQYTGGTTVNAGGTLKLDFTASGAATTNIINGGALNLGYGGLSIAGNGGANTLESFSGTTLNAGAATLVFTNTAAGPPVVALGAITRNAGSVLDVTPPSVGSITTTTLGTGTNKLLPGVTASNYTTWATSAGDGTNPGAITGLTLGSYSAQWASGTDVDCGTTGTVPGTVTSINSLRFNSNAAVTTTLTQPLTIATGGILVTSTVSGKALTITGSQITSGNGNDLVLVLNGTSPTSLTIASQITNSGATPIGLTKSNGNPLTLSSVNTFTGPVNIFAGVVTLAADNALGRGSVINMKNPPGANGGIQLVFHNVAYTNAPTLNVVNGGWNTTPEITCDLGASSFNGNINLPSYFGNNIYLGVKTGCSLALGGSIAMGAPANAGSLNWNYDTSNTGTLTLSGNSPNLTSSVIFKYGTLILQGESAPFSATSGTLTVGTNTSVTTPVELRLVGGTTLTKAATGNIVDYGVIHSYGANSIPNGIQLASEFSGSTAQNVNHVFVDCGTLSIGATNNQALPVNLVLGGAAGGGGVGTFTAAITQNSGTNTIALTDNGATWDLNGVNTYTGATTVQNRARLLVNGSIAAGSNVSVIGGGTLGGTGTVNGPLVVNVGNLSPGASPGKLTLANRAWFTSSTDNYIVDINGAPAFNYDNTLYKVSMNLAGASLVINDLVYKAGSPHANDKFYIMDSDNSAAGAAIAGTFNGLAGGATVYGASGLGYTITYNVSGDPKGTSHDVLLTANAVPEPATLAMLGTAACGALGFLRRRRAK